MAIKRRINAVTSLLTAGSSECDDILVSGSQSIGLHHKFVKFLRFLDTPEVPTALTQEILEIEIIYDAGQYFLISESQNIGPHHKFL